MAKVLQKFGFKKHEPRESEARQRLQKELFAYNKSVDHGFPHKPTAMAYDPKLKLLAIGTKTGAIKLIGSPGVEFSGQHDDDIAINGLYFLPEQARIITLCSDNSLHLWSLDEKQDVQELQKTKKFEMEESEDYPRENKLKKISTCAVTRNGEYLLIGTEGGNIHLLDTLTFKLNDQIVYQDVVMQNVPDDFKVAQGAVEVISQHPSDDNKFLIGYNRGGIVLWDLKESNADQTYNATQQLESVAWHRDGKQFMSAHADGSYIVWSTSDSSGPKEQANTPYGPFPCKAISKVQWKTAKADNFLVFSGGMPRPSYADRHTVTVQQGAHQVVFDFTSRVVDFTVLSSTDDMEDPDKNEFDDPQSLVVLVEEELVVIDLQGDGWPTYRLPYLASPHSSAITCSHHAGRVPEELWNKLMDIGEGQDAAHSTRDWPIWGGHLKSQNESAPNTRELLLTGHEDGTIRFWDASGICLKLICKFGTAAVFGCDFSNAEAGDDGENDWPPFRKVGTFDPYSDDPRLGIQKLALCPVSETLVVGGTAGQVVVLSFDKEEKQVEVKSTLVNIVSDRDNFIWKGHEALTVVEGEFKQPAGFQAQSVMQLHPPASITALAVQSEWQLIAAGTAHGLGVFDFNQNKEVTVKCTLNPDDMTGAGESPMARGKSFKKSLRESFRRFRKRRSERRKKVAEEKADKETEKKKDESIKEEKAAGDADKKDDEAPAEAAAGDAAGGDAGAAAEEKKEEDKEEKKVEDKIEEVKEEEEKKEEEKKSVTSSPSHGTRTLERPVEARTAEDAMASMVRSLYFAQTFLLNGTQHNPTLWAGTNSGAIFIFQVEVPGNEKRDSDAVTCQLAKEIHLKHHAPVVAMTIIDKNAHPLPNAFEVEHQLAKAPDMSGSHQVVICSEEQFKIFSLPNLKPQNKFKLTAHEGSKVRKTGFVNFTSRSDENYSENDLVVVTNQGDVHVFTIPHLRRQLKASPIRKDNVNGIVSCVLSKNGEGFFPCSPSEFVRFSLTAKNIIAPECGVEIKEGVRPAEPEPEPEVEMKEDEGAVAASPNEEGEKNDEKKEGEETAPADESTVTEPADLSALTADLTIDSVKEHISESSHVTKVTSSRSVVTKTVVKKVTDGEGTVTTSETTTVTSNSAPSGDIDSSKAAEIEAAIEAMKSNLENAHSGENTVITTTKTSTTSNHPVAEDIQTESEAQIEEAVAAVTEPAVESTPSAEVEEEEEKAVVEEVVESSVVTAVESSPVEDVAEEDAKEETNGKNEEEAAEDETKTADETNESKDDEPTEESAGGKEDDEETADAEEKAASNDDDDEAAGNDKDSTAVNGDDPAVNNGNDTQETNDEEDKPCEENKEINQDDEAPASNGIKTVTNSSDKTEPENITSNGAHNSADES